MKSIPTLFFVTGAICALLGMIWGIQMSASHNHTLSPAHGHLNLLGFVAMSVFGAFYALSPDAAVSRMAKLHYALALASVVVLTPGIALAIGGTTEVLAQLGSVLSLVTMGLFVAVLLRFGVGQPAFQHRG